MRAVAEKKAVAYRRAACVQVIKASIGAELDLCGARWALDFARSPTAQASSRGHSAYILIAVRKSWAGAASGKALSAQARWSIFSSRCMSTRRPVAAERSTTASSSAGDDAADSIDQREIGGRRRRRPGEELLGGLAGLCRQGIEERVTVAMNEGLIAHGQREAT